MRLLNILGALMLACFVFGGLFTRESYVQAQYPSETPVPLSSGTPFPTMGSCSSSNNNCDDCAEDCPPPATCTNFCNYNTGACAFTCSTYQSTCAGGWGAWGDCDNCYQFRVCNGNPSLGQMRPCGSDCVPTGPGGTPDIEPTVPPSANWMFARACWRNVTTGASGQGLTGTLAANQILRWDIGYKLGTAWVQAEGEEAGMCMPKA